MRGLILATLRHYRGLNTLVVGGVAVAVAVLGGALLVGASVRASLRDLALARLGHTDVAVSASGHFRESLAAEVTSPDIDRVVPIVAVQAAVVHEDSRRAAARVQVFGIDDRFLAFHGQPAGAPQGRDAWISPGLAAELGAARGDSLLLRLARPNDIPLSHLQGRRDETGERIRLTVDRVVARDALGEFSLVPAQGPVFTVFVALSRLQQDLDWQGRANTLLVHLERPIRDAVGDVRAALAPAVRLDDLGLTVRQHPSKAISILESRTGLLPEPIWQAAALRASDRGGRPVGVLAYLANSIRANGREIPYSLVAAMDVPAGEMQTPAAPAGGADPPIWLNEWAASDLAVAPGDRVEIDYYLWSDQDGLQTRQAAFTFAGVVPMNGLGGDATLTPEYPGITDAGDVTSWDPPFPVDLSRVRPADEAYWDRWRAAPKAFVPLAVGQRLWPSPFGTLSSLRVEAVVDWPPVVGLDTALAIRDVRGDALAAADGTTDFGEYFVYFSFFLVVAGLLLAGMFFALGVEQRARELGLLLAVGYRAADLRRMLLGEAMVITAVASAIGMVGAVGYAALIMYGLRTWWVDAVNTTALELHVDPLWLAVGAGGAFAASLAALALALRRVGRRSPRALLLGGLGDGTLAPAHHRRGVVWKGLLALALALVAAGMLDAVPAAAAFFGAGALLMASGCAWFAHWLRTPSTALHARTTSVWRFGASYARWRPTRSVLSAALIAFACFIIVAVAAFRRDGAGVALSREGGTGGFALLAESVAPLMHNPNTATGRDELGLGGYDELAATHVTRFRLRPGDEASCLTLYQPTNPRIIAPEPAFLHDGRFTFSASLASTDEERANPWLLLNRRFEDGAIPAIADQTTLTYVFHLGVGDDFVFAPDGTTPVRLRIVGALADSVLQSELVIGEHDFTRLFPAHEGYRVWLIDTPEGKADGVAALLEDRLSDYGLDVTGTRARLAAYHQVENTYLSTFQALGALGLLLGTLGLAAVLARNVLERRREIGLLGAVGFTPRHLRRLVAAESVLLVGTGVAVGTVAALVAIAPAVLDRASTLPVGAMALLVAAVVVTGLLASMAAVRIAGTARVVDAIKNE